MIRRPLHRAARVGVVIGALLAALARPGAADAPAVDASLSWVPAPVRAVAGGVVLPSRETPMRVGVRQAVGPDAGAALWLDDGDVVRLTTSASAALPTLHARVVATTPAGVVATDVPLLARSDDRLLLVPPGTAGWWVVGADAPAELTLEKLTRRGGRLVWEQHLDAVRAWIDGGTAAPPPTPPTPAADLTRRLAADAALAREVATLAGDTAAAPPLARATRAIRVASALLAELTARPALPAYVDSAPVDVALADAELATPPAFTVEGPAVLAIDVTGLPGVDLDVTVRSHGAIIASAFRAAPPRGRDAPAEATRRTASLRVPIGHGRVSVTLATVGASALEVKRRTARPRLRGWWRDRRVDAELRRACAALPALTAPTPAVATAIARTRAACDGLLGAAPLLPVAAPPDDDAPALDVATARWRATPAAPTTRAALRAAWRAARWRRLAPDREAARDATATWLALTSPTAASDDDEAGGGADDRGGLWEVPPDAPTPLQVLASTTPDAPALVTFRLVTARAGEVATLTIDGQPYPVVALDRVTPLRFAMAPGSHTVAITSAAGARLLVDGAAAQSPGRMATAAVRQRLTAVPTSGDAVGFEVPADAPALRLTSRRAAGTPTVAHLTLHSASGWSTTIALAPTATAAAVDVAAVPLDDAPAVGPRSDATVWLPAGVGRVWLTADVPTLLVGVSARRAPPRAASTPRPATAPAPAVPPAAAMPRLAALSAAIAAEPRAVAPRLERAELLLALGEASLARAELAGALRLDVDGAGARDQVAGLLARVAPRSDAGFLPPQPTPLPAVLPLTPALLAMPSASVIAIAPAIATVAGGGRPPPLAADERDPARRWLAAYAARDAAEPTAMLHAVWSLLDDGLWQAGLDALTWTPRDAISPGVATAQYAVARAVDDVLVHPLARARLALAGRHSRWTALRGADRSAGDARIPLAAVTTADPGDAIRRALAGVPDADVDNDALEVLAPDDVATLRYDSALAGDVTVTTRCAEPFASAPSRCHLAWRLDGGAWADLAMPLARLALPSGKHVVEVAPRELPATGLAVVGFDGSAALTPPTTTRVDWATARAPVEVMVVGPALLRIDLRDDRTSPATRATVSVDDAPRGAPIELPSVTDPAVAPFDLSPRATTLVRVSAPGPHRVRVAVASGRVAVRMLRRTGVDLAEPPRDELAPPPRPVVPSPLAEAPPAVPGATMARALAPATAAVELTVGNQDATEVTGDTTDGAQRAGASLGLFTSRGAARAALELRGRAWDARPTSFGVRGRLRWQARPTLALALDVRADASDSADGLAWSGRANLSADLQRPLTPALDLLLGGEAAGRIYDGAHPGEDLDVRVASPYGRDHPLTLQPRVGLRYAPLQDLQLRSAAELRSNSNLYTIDQLMLSAGVRAQLEVAHLRGPAAQLQYAPTLRLADDDRAATSWRHAVSLGLEHVAWRPRAGYLLVTLDADVFIEPGRDLGSTIQLGLRWLLPGGRGLRDLWPGDVFPIEYAEPRWWQPPR